MSIFTRLDLSLVVVALAVVLFPRIPIRSDGGAVPQSGQRGRPSGVTTSWCGCTKRMSPSGDLQGKLSRLLSTPFVNNAASQRDARPLTASPRVAESCAWRWEHRAGLEFEAVSAGPRRG